MNIVGIIPARYASTRFPGKPLVVIAGQTMIHRVIERAQASGLFARVVVATDDQRIGDHVVQMGYEAVMTAEHHQSGTDRCAEALGKLDIKADAVINIQGDEPFVHPEQLRLLAQQIELPHVPIATLIKPIDTTDHLFDANKVKVVIGEGGRALYFSRQAIPMQRGIALQDWLNHSPYYKHLGLYAYKTDVLRELVQLPVSRLEKAESLEQLRWLENGYSIYTSLTDIETPAIDTPADLEQLLTRWPLV